MIHDNMRIKKYRIEYGEDRENILVLESSKNFPNIIGKNLNNPQKIVDCINIAFNADRQLEEYAYMVCMDTKCHPVGFFEVSHGSVCETIMSSKSIFQRALLSGAASIVIVHTHPSGEPTPSKADREVYEKIKEAGKLIDIELIDFIIIGDNCYHSFSEND